MDFVSLVKGAVCQLRHTWYKWHAAAAAVTSAAKSLFGAPWMIAMFCLACLLLTPASGLSDQQRSLGFHSFIETLTGWVSMLSPEFGQEIRKAMISQIPLRTANMNKDQVERSRRLYYLLKQALEKSLQVA